MDRVSEFHFVVISGKVEKEGRSSPHAVTKRGKRVKIQYGQRRDKIEMGGKSLILVAIRRNGDPIRIAPRLIEDSIDEP